MRRSDLVRRLRKLHGEMRPNLLAAGIEEERVDSFLMSIDDRSDDVISEYTTKLTDLAAGPYREFMSIWGLKHPEWWANMSMLGETDLREHRLLRPLAKTLRAEWREMHRKPKKTEP